MKPRSGTIVAAVIALVVGTSGLVAIRMLRPPQRPAGTRVTVRVENVEMREFCEQLATAANANIVVDPDVRGAVSAELRNEPWDRALERVARERGFVAEREGNLVRVSTAERWQREQREPRRIYRRRPIDLDVKNADVRAVFAMLEKTTGEKITVAPGVKATVTMRVRAVPADQVSDIIVRQHDLRVRRR